MNTIIEVSELWVPFLAALIPGLVAFATAPTSGNRKRALLAFAASGGIAVLEQLIDGAVSVEGLLSTFLIAFVSQFTAYQAAWKPIIDANSRIAPNVALI